MAEHGRRGIPRVMLQHCCSRWWTLAYHCCSRTFLRAPARQAMETRVFHSDHSREG
eukprot:COSAG02_NODE_1098_length_14587_cov_9.462590_14_plen_56_part_00